MSKHDLALSIIPDLSSIQKKTDEKSTVEIGEVGVETGWDKVKTIKKSYHHKPNPDEWNSSDLQWYLKSLYIQKYGVKLHIPIANRHKWIKSIKYSFFKRYGEEPKHSVIKDYFDFCAKFHMDEIIRYDGTFSLYKLTKPKYLLDYFDKKIEQQAVTTPPQPTPQDRKIPKQNVENTDNTNDGDLSLEIIGSAYRISPHYMVSKYGFIITMNYLVCVKDKSLEDAFAYINKAIAKLTSKGELDKALESTARFEPYPRWLRFTDVKKITDSKITLSDDNPRFECFEFCKE